MKELSYPTLAHAIRQLDAALQRPYVERSDKPPWTSIPLRRDVALELLAWLKAVEAETQAKAGKWARAGEWELR